MTAWCVDIFDNLQSATYTNGNASSINNLDKLQQLVNQDYSKVNNAETSAAFQLAVWDIVNENAGASSFSLGDGKFTASGGSGLAGYGTPINILFGDGSSAISLANSWLLLKGPNTGNYKIAYFEQGSTATQNLISVSPVPLPNSSLLMLTALGLGSILLTKRRSLNTPA